MIYSRKYSRNFVPLKQDNPKHNLDFRASMGKCVIEIKDNVGKISLYAQGIKPKTKYELELIGFEKGNVKNASLGTLNVDCYGRAELTKTFNPDNVLDTNNKIEDFNVITVLVKGENDISSALVGYIDKEIDWQESYKTNFFNRGRDCCCNPKPEEKPEEKPEQKPQEPSEKEKGLDELEEGLIEKEKGLEEKEKGLIEKEKNQDKATKLPLDDYENKINERLKGLLEREMGLMEKEQGLIQRERELRKGNLPKEDKAIEERELDLIGKEEELLKKEQELIKKEQELVRKNPQSEREAGLIEKEKGTLEKEQGLIERERGLIEKEKGLIELEKGLRESRKPNKEDNKEEIPQKEPREEENNHDNFKKMLENLRESMLNIQNIEEIKESEISPIDNNIEYIQKNNAKMTPFEDDDTDWYRIAPFELSAISKEAEKFQDNFVLALAYKKYRHIMLGIKKDDEGKETYLLAIPSKYEDDFNMKDFRTFVAIDKNIGAKSISTNDYGYRIEII